MNILNEKHGQGWAAYNADCIEFAAQLPDNSIDFSVYSPPFANLYVYSDSERDLGNCANDAEFIQQYGYLLKEMHRAMRPGRICAVHCADLTTFKWKDGYIGLRDLSGEIIRAHQAAGFIFHSRVTVWKDPVTEMQRTKALGLLYKQLCKDSCMSRQGNPDYVLVFRKDGVNDQPVTKNAEHFPVDRWQQWASPVWMDIEQGNVLNGRLARSEKDEKHVCPLQLDLIERAMLLWSNEGDTVFSPFMGIGSEGFVSVKNGRKFIGTELKPEYWRQACEFLAVAEAEGRDLFAA